MFEHIIIILIGFSVPDISNGVMILYFTIQYRPDKDRTIEI